MKGEHNLHCQMSWVWKYSNAKYYPASRGFFNLTLLYFLVFGFMAVFTTTDFFPGEQ